MQEKSKEYNEKEQQVAENRSRNTLFESALWKRSPALRLHIPYGSRSGMRSHLTVLYVHFSQRKLLFHHRSFQLPVLKHLLMQLYSYFHLILYMCSWNMSSPGTCYSSSNSSSTVQPSLAAFALGKICFTSSIYSSGLVRDGL